MRWRADGTTTTNRSSLIRFRLFLLRIFPLLLFLLGTISFPLSPPRLSTITSPTSFAFPLAFALSIPLSFRLTIPLPLPLKIPIKIASSAREGHATSGSTTSDRPRTQEGFSACEKER